MPVIPRCTTAYFTSVTHQVFDRWAAQDTSVIWSLGFQPRELANYIERVSTAIAEGFWTESNGRSELRFPVGKLETARHDANHSELGGATLNLGQSN